MTHFVHTFDFESIKCRSHFESITCRLLEAYLVAGLLNLSHFRRSRGAVAAYAERGCQRDDEQHLSTGTLA
jgi:hypothetical protein